MKIGMIGIGDIAKKAYLPVITQTEGIELHVCTRNSETLQEVAAAYHLQHTYQDIDSLIDSGIDAAFVHAATEAHEAIIDKLLDNKIHVFVDKPITYEAASSRRLIEKAEKKELILMTGFNRRYAPSYQKLKEIGEPNMVLVQKHRANHAGEIRTFIFDDFIHVIDTLLYLFPYPIENVHVSHKVQNEELHHLMLQLEAKQGTAIGIMNREAGMTGEKASVFSPNETRTVDNVNVLTSYQDRNTLTHGSSDWESTLNKRGFHAIINSFLERVRTNNIESWKYKDDLERHLLAEKVVQYCLSD